MLQAAARVAHNVEAETRAYEIRMRAARKVGQLSKKIEKAQGARSDLVANGHEVRKSKRQALVDAGMTKEQASDWERLADVPQNRFETALATKSVRDLIDKPSLVTWKCSPGGLQPCGRPNRPCVSNGPVFALRAHYHTGGRLLQGQRALEADRKGFL